MVEVQGKAALMKRKRQHFSDKQKLTVVDYTELMAEYAKLGETITNAGDDFSSSSAMAIYTNMLTKSTKLTELYLQLGQ
ncbi:hypothetical protein [Enterococcus sp. LJL51]|uniref:hypothetical protein n=1 Tax=Enterococcus sp. LJL51 TaxID=3416656 RepID=UPI003CEC8BCE